MDPSSASVFDEAHDTGADAEPHPASAIRIVGGRRQAASVFGAANGGL
jgi:hypothetical protein